MDSNSFTSRSMKILQSAVQLARDRAHAELLPLHLAHALFVGDRDGCARAALGHIGQEPDALERQLRRQLASLPTLQPAPDTPATSSGVARLLRRAEDLRRQQRDTHIAADHLLAALLELAAEQSGDGWQQLQAVGNALRDASVPRQALAAAVHELRGTRHVTSADDDGSAAGASGAAARDPQGNELEHLPKYAVDLVARAVDGKLDPVIGRDDEVRRVIRVLARRTKNNPVLVGAPGTGKTAIVELLAQRIASGDVPETLRDARVWALDMGQLIAGAKYRGEFEERLQGVLAEVRRAEGKILLFIDELHLVLGSGQSEGSPMDAANLLKPMLARGELRMIGATTDDEYRRHVERDAAFERRLQPVRVAEPTVDDCISILRGVKERYESHHGVQIADAALVLAAQLAKRYITHRQLPDSAIDLMDEACAMTRVALDSAPEELDSLERRLVQLQVEATALEKELASLGASTAAGSASPADDDTAGANAASAQTRLVRVRDEMATLQEQIRPLRMQYKTEKQRIQDLRQLQTKLDELRARVADAERRLDLPMAADLKYYAIPDIEARIRELQTAPPVTEGQQQQQPSRRRLLTERVGPDQVAEVVARWTGIPVQRLTQSQADKLLHLDDRLARRVIGQPDAVRAVSEAILRSRAGLARQQQPIGSFLFLGSSGCGKTELCKALAVELFDSERHMVRIDMSEYSERHSTARLIGAPPGYVGHQEGGQLTEAVRRQPYSIVLLDEIEKAHAEVHLLLLQLLDDGRLTDSRGRVVDFSNCVVIMTSNLGSEYIIDAMERRLAGDASRSRRWLTDADKQAILADAPMRQRVLQTVRQHFRPEFLNRLDDQIVFGPLSRSDLDRILDAQLAEIGQRLAGRAPGLAVELDADARTWLLDRGTGGDQARNGARPLRRICERELVTALARVVLEPGLLQRFDEQRPARVLIGLRRGTKLSSSSDSEDDLMSPAAARPDTKSVVCQRESEHRWSFGVIQPQDDGSGLVFAVEFSDPFGRPQNVSSAAASDEDDDDDMMNTDDDEADAEPKRSRLTSR